MGWEVLMGWGDSDGDGMLMHVRVVNVVGLIYIYWIGQW